MADNHTPLEVMPASLPPIKPKAYPVPADLEPRTPPTASIPKVLLRMPPVTRRPAMPPLDAPMTPYYRRLNMTPMAEALPAPITPKMILSRMSEEQVKNNLFMHAVRELVTLGYSIPMSISRHECWAKAGITIPKSFSTSDDINDLLVEQILAMVSLFTGHSGMSAGYTSAMLTELLSFRALTPVTSNPDEWYQHGDIMDEATDFWQNKRQGDCFSSDPQLRHYWKLDDRTWFGRSWMYKKMPVSWRKWINNSHIYWINKKHTTAPDPLHPTPGTTTDSTPIVKQAPKHAKKS